MLKIDSEALAKMIVENERRAYEYAQMLVRNDAGLQDMGGLRGVINQYAAFYLGNLLEVLGSSQLFVVRQLCLEDLKDLPFYHRRIWGKMADMWYQAILYYPLTSDGNHLRRAHQRTGFQCTWRSRVLEEIVQQRVLGNEKLKELLKWKETSDSPITPLVGMVRRILIKFMKDHCLLPAVEAASEALRADPAEIAYVVGPQDTPQEAIARVMPWINMFFGDFHGAEGKGLLEEKQRAAAICVAAGAHGKEPVYRTLLPIWATLQRRFNK